MAEKKPFPDNILKSPKLEHDLRSAHITIPVEQYMMLTILMTMLTGVLVLLVGVCLTVFGIELPLPIPLWLIIAAAVFLVPVGTFLCFYYYPSLEASGRKNKIEQDLPYAITYMQALSSTVTLYTIFRNVYDAADLYGEV